MSVSLSPSQLNALAVTERVTSIFSMLGILFILATFLLGRGFDKPINRLIFFASWSNLGMNIASLIAEDGPGAGQNSSLCQFQALAIQMFLGVDVLWALCMSVNVYLALFRGWTAKRMRAQEWKYFIGCYGVSFIPALVYLFINTHGRGRVYGPALLWCWIDTQWDFLRVATLYGIVWVAIFFAFCIYCLAFTKIWRHRHDLSGLFNPFNEDPFVGTITTDIEIVRTSRKELSEVKSHQEEPETDVPPIPGTEGETTREFDPYTVDVEVGNDVPDETHRLPSTRPEIFRVGSITRNAALQETNPDAWLYARVAFLFFCALLLSWVPSSINRVYSLAHPNTLNFGANYVEALVLPLQGFWNACVYIITSQTACRNLYRAVVGKQELPRKSDYWGDLDAAGGGGGVGMTSLAKGDVGAGGGVGGKLDRFNSRRTSQKLRDPSDVTSVTSLTAAHRR